MRVQRARPTAVTLRRARPAVLLLAVALAGCTTATPTPAPTSSPSRPPASAAPARSGPTDSPPPSVLPASPAPTATVPAETGWTEVWPGSSDSPGHLTAAIATDNGFVVAGSDATGHAPIALSSADGSTWTTESVPGGPRTPLALARWGDGLLATGAGEVNCAHPYGLDTWVREPTGTWTEAPFDPILCDGSSVQIATVGRIAVLAGIGPGDNPILWSSADGLHWTDRGRVVAGLLPGGVVGDGTQAWVIGTGSGSTWIAYTTDGLAWTPPERIHDIPELEIRGVFLIRDSPLIVASVGGSVGIVDPGTGGGWVTSPATGLDPEALASVGQFDGGLLATGVQSGAAALAWVSADGVSWRSLALPEALAAPDASVVAVAVRGERAILVGSVVAGGGSAVSRIWTGPAALALP